ncbi:hypothetical protein [Cellulosilyticum lentocellum]|uniref:Uncharacterized protein n=1 Tax=Cellulosilyticum lentocellum (strain ATCC 49066 / DSM 5427 / NCIMB 11756 / RHM5) TaxID=642492 RepID=F2JSS3_CELLD|nr:hypothetical protein [Cellulosilyticum lentocellum]ADZ82907.1 hypothetical protein Clole_1178 [Cellulosilyticum lentocellum DSM 5427]
MKLFKSKRQRQLESISNTLDEIDEGIADLQQDLDEMQMLAKECLVICNRIIEQLER